MRTRMIQLAAICLLTLSGCGGDDAPQPLDSNAFYRRNGAIVPGPGVGPRSPVGPVDEAGRVDPIVRKADSNEQVSGISDTVAESVPPRLPPSHPLVWAPPSTVPTTQVATTTAPTTLPTGQYMIVGVVL